jgi:hypothetical protein
MTVKDGLGQMWKVGFLKLLSQNFSGVTRKATKMLIQDSRK